MIAHFREWLVTPTRCSALPRAAPAAVQVPSLVNLTTLWDLFTGQRWIGETDTALILHIEKERTTDGGGSLHPLT